MTKKILYALIVMVIMLSVIGPTSAEAAWGYRLVAGQNQIVGWVFAWTDATNLYVQFATKYKLGFCLAETHLHVADTWEGIPQTNGNPIPGQFAYKSTHDCAQTFIYAVPLSSGGWGVGDDITIAAHAVVESWRDPDWEETAWGVVCGDITNNQFPGANWAVFAPYHIQPNPLEPNY